MTRSGIQQSDEGHRSTAVSYSWRLLGPNVELRDPAELRRLLLTQRGIDQESESDFFEPQYDQALHSPTLLSGMDEALIRIDAALLNKQHIAIYGDYDIDGITATALLLDVLGQLGAKVEPYIPDRFEEGYGLNLGALKSLKESGVDLVISVDCGITAATEVVQAKEFGLDIIITDHHSVPKDIPAAAVACLNPRLVGNKYPFKELAGVGVAFKLACALAQRHADRIKPGHEKWLLDLVALGTVCDVVPLVGENRVLTKFGLTVLRKSPRKGLRALAEASSVELQDVGASELGFRFGPRLNAAGRLEHASKALELLTTTRIDRAKELAGMLSELNRERQEDTIRVFAEAMEQARQYVDDEILVLSDSSWSHGIVGLVASRVSEAMHKPTLVLQELGGVTKGSARSIGSFSIIDAVTSCAGLLERFGGHAFAAGMTLKTSRIAQLRQQLNRYAIAHRNTLGSDKELPINATLAVALLRPDTLRLLQAFEPFGNGNAQPIFATTLILTYMRPVGSDLKHLQMRFMASGSELGAIAFSAARRWPWLEVGQEVEVAYRLSKNVWQGVERLQLEVQDIRPVQN